MSLSNITPPPAIEIDAVRMVYGDFAALDSVSLRIEAGEFLTLLGPSGSGKTTLLNILAGFAYPQSGAVRFGGEDVTALPANRRDLGMVFQNYALFPHMSVGENVAFPLSVRKVPAGDIRKRVADALRLVRLESMTDRNVAALSGGQRQRVALARAVVFSPRIVLMDEPLSALDKNLREEMQVEIRHLHRRIGATTVYVTHDQREAMTMSDRIAVMDRGHIVQCAKPSDIYDRPASRFVAGFVGETNLLSACRRGESVSLAGGTPIAGLDAVPDVADLILVVRAERVLLPGEIGPLHARVTVEVSDVIYQGDSVLIIAALPDGTPIQARRQIRARLADFPTPGSKVEFGIDPAATPVVPA